jgi:hypothetical protein
MLASWDEKWWFHGGFMVVSWWFNDGLMMA